ncbi:MAG: tRNA lysidine(34) synthetase TilS [Actinomycetes bacterium]
MPNRPRLTPAIADVRRAVREQLEGLALTAGDLVLAACSGGADSLALAAALAFEAPRLGLLGGAVIVEHGLQPETKTVAVETAAVLSELGLNPVEVVEVKVGKAGGPEAAARDARYEALAATAKRLGATFVLLGHTMNDQAETVLLGLHRGSGARSLSGMAPATGIYLRPLLEISRETTEAFCSDSGLKPWHDPQNQDPTFSRVRVRRELLPAIESTLGAGMVEALGRTAEQLREDADYLEIQAAETFAALAKVQANAIELPADALAAAPRAVSTRVIKLALEKFAPGAQRVHVLAVLDLALNYHGQKPLELRGVRVERKGQTITMVSTKPPRPGAC